MYTTLPPGPPDAIPAKTLLDDALMHVIRVNEGKIVSQKDFAFGSENHPARGKPS